jgi:hypothetical protein
MPIVWYSANPGINDIRKEFTNPLRITPWKMLLHLAKMCTLFTQKVCAAQVKVATTNSLIIPYKNFAQGAFVVKHVDISATKE